LRDCTVVSSFSEPITDHCYLSLPIKDHVVAVALVLLC
jgi:hypothetical protein